MKLGDGDDYLLLLTSDIINLNTKIKELSVFKQLPYLTSTYNGKTLTHIDQVREEIISILQLEDKNIITGVTGLSGAGKGTLLHLLQQILDGEKVLRSEKVRDRNGKKIRDKSLKSIKLTNDKGGYLLSSGYTFPKFNKSIFLAELDGFFKLVDRYTRMLENESNFVELYSDDSKVIQVIHDFLTRIDKYIINGINQKTSRERELKQGLSELTIQEKIKGVGDFIILDGVNASNVMNLYGQVYDIKGIVQILLMLSPTEENIFGAFCRILNRDVILKGRDLYTITKFRLVETFYIMKIYMLEALKKGLSNKDIFTMIDLPHLTDNHLDKPFIGNVISSLDKSRDKLLETELFPELGNFVEEYCEFLVDRFSQE